ncbi:hypothetical protein MIND_01425000 [Mycena indigotica]|uniref:Uncharacterized protein n=1 Tax=Mycena indigotica TaxID=2126181 RepID=A0A8H6RYN4_9AGAR|nr:uncharacterized protein MIND_01431100 [Mycena indigotica]XP_037212899.1 uncharacterized protein MIND_01431300 [Mycena indigotica]XP_037213013.1 uncharacterized protein MIND_01425000 [Mycena indigotica]KAF7288489.1 hypothetical protein MIND_01431100 [Mycena indigotica]KAF7288491.1 hypothetical protein MIND_01431300 [Mycena indigotica]KAF7288791.1 hypothetical protein MIND_01425000 [Mycena indigotica]
MHSRSSSGLRYRCLDICTPAMLPTFSFNTTACTMAQTTTKCPGDTLSVSRYLQTQFFSRVHLPTAAARRSHARRQLPPGFSDPSGAGHACARMTWLCKPHPSSTLQSRDELFHRARPHFYE